MAHSRGVQRMTIRGMPARLLEDTQYCNGIHLKHFSIVRYTVIVKHSEPNDIKTYWDGRMHTTIFALDTYDTVYS